MSASQLGQKGVTLKGHLQGEVILNKRAINKTRASIQFHGIIYN